MSDIESTNVMILHSVPEDHKAYISKLLNNYSQIKMFYPESKEQQISMAPKMDVFVGRSVDLDVLEASKKLQMYVFPGTGVDGLMKTYSKFSRRDEVILCNTHRSSYNCAQHAVAMLLGLMNQLFIHDKRMRNQDKRQRDPESILLMGKTIGLLGYGPINQFIHDFLKGFNVDFAILKRTWVDEEISENITKYTPANLMDFLREIDVLSIALPLTNETEGMIGSQELDILGKDSFLITVARGAIVKQEALFNALREKKIAGAGLDVWYHVEEEKIYGYDKKYPFHDLNNVILSPHRGNSGGDITRWDSVFVNIKKMVDEHNDFEYVIDVNRGY
ncbi:MAG: NAD(P)-dependent oxidoreductase [Candidatus Kariarchaeaceae archaeon]|jgi:D-3-phosphoglycerate dehydrogenase